MCSDVSVLAVEHTVKNLEQTVIKRSEALENARFWKTSWNTSSHPVQIERNMTKDEFLHSSKKYGVLWTPHVLFDLDGYR